MYRGIEIGHQNSTSSIPKQFTEALYQMITLGYCYFLIPASLIDVLEIKVR